MAGPWPLGRLQRAQGLVEAALVFPLLMVLVLGILQFALYYHARDVLIGAAQEGARLAAEDGRTPDEGIDRAVSLVAAGLGSTVDPVQPSVVAQDDVVQVVLTTQLTPIIPLPIGTAIAVQGHATVARERFRPDGGSR